MVSNELVLQKVARLVQVCNNLTNDWWMDEAYIEGYCEESTDNNDYIDVS